VVPPGEPDAYSGHYRVHPVLARLARRVRRGRHPVPQHIQLPPIEKIGRLPAKETASPGLAPGGETAGRKRFVSWRQRLLAGYGENHDDLVGDATSRLSAYLRFGCVSPLEVALGTLDRPAGGEQGEEYCRQPRLARLLYQVTVAFPDIARKSFRPGAAWHEDRRALDAWREGQTGIPIVDAGLRQLAAEGFMHNRARMVTASFLTRNLGIDWRHGLAHFDALLADADVANNAGNWQCVSGTGHNTRPNRVMNPLRQAQRFDRSGEYVRRYVPELAGLDPAWIQTPWKLPPAQRVRMGYPGPLVELA
jgi:deoxyribodipyrimidine photo-lyase